MTKADLSLGFVGLGALGLPMAINLHKAGFPLRVHTRSRTAETDPELEGATPCSSPADASTGVDVLLLCVSDDAAVEQVLFGANGAASQLGAGSVVLDCSTIAPATAQRCAERLAHQNVHYLDAPVTGGTEGAKRGSLTVLVGGASEPLERVRPILEVIGGSIHHFGERGAGAAGESGEPGAGGRQLCRRGRSGGPGPASGAAHAPGDRCPQKWCSRLMGPRPSQHRHAGGQLSPRLPAQPASQGSRHRPRCSQGRPAGSPRHNAGGTAGTRSDQQRPW